MIQPQGNGTWTGIGLVNPGQKSCDVIFELFDDHGHRISQGTLNNLPPKVKTVDFVEGFLHVPAPGWLKVTSSQNLIAFELFGENGNAMVSGFNSL